MLTANKYGVNCFRVWGLLPLFFTLMSFSSIAQDEVADTTTMYDEEMVESDEESEEEQIFWERSQYSAASDTIKTRRLPPGHASELKKDKAFWYADLELNKKDPKEKRAGVSIFRQQWFQVLLWIVIIGGFGAFLMIYLSGSNVGLFRKKSRSSLESGEAGISEDIFVINYQAEIDQAIRDGNYRLAVRLMFLRVLKKLSEKNVIQYKQERTNLDYLLQLHPTRYYNDFFRITRNYEYSWYGQFEVNADTFARIRSDFSQFENQID